EQRLFFEMAVALSRFEPGLRLVATLQSDFLGPLSARRGSAETLLHSTLLLGPLRRGALLEGVTAPARVGGGTVPDPGDVQALIDEAVGHEAGLMQLAFVLAELWERRDAQRRVIPRQALQELGGVGGALARHADGVVAGMPPEQQRAARACLLGLIT